MLLLPVSPLWPDRPGGPVMGTCAVGRSRGHLGSTFFRMPSVNAAIYFGRFVRERTRPALRAPIVRQGECATQLARPRPLVQLTLESQRRSSDLGGTPAHRLVPRRTV